MEIYLSDVSEETPEVSPRLPPWTRWGMLLRRGMSSLRTRIYQRPERDLEWQTRYTSCLLLLDEWTRSNQPYQLDLSGYSDLLDLSVSTLVSIACLVYTRTSVTSLVEPTIVGPTSQ